MTDEDNEQVTHLDITHDRLVQCRWCASRAIDRWLTDECRMDDVWCLTHDRSDLDHQGML